jgi:hypothetical protein
MLMLLYSVPGCKSWDGCIQYAFAPLVDLVFPQKSSIWKHTQTKAGRASDEFVFYREPCKQWLLMTCKYYPFMSVQTALITAYQIFLKESV